MAVNEDQVHTEFWARIFGDFGFSGYLWNLVPATVLSGLAPRLGTYRSLDQQKRAASTTASGLDAQELAARNDAGNLIASEGAFRGPVQYTGDCSLQVTFINHIQVRTGLSRHCSHGETHSEIMSRQTGPNINRVN